MGHDGRLCLGTWRDGLICRHHMKFVLAAIGVANPRLTATTTPRERPDDVGGSWREEHTW